MLKNKNTLSKMNFKVINIRDCTEHTNESSNHDQVTRSSDCQQTKKKKRVKKRTCRIVDFAVPADHRVNLKGNT